VDLYRSRTTAFRYTASYRGVLIPQQPGRDFHGVIGATGALNAQMTFPDLGPGVDAKYVYLQARTSTRREIGRLALRRA